MMIWILNYVWKFIQVLFWVMQYSTYNICIRSIKHTTLTVICKDSSKSDPTFLKGSLCRLDIWSRPVFSAIDATYDKLLRIDSGKISATRINDIYWHDILYLISTYFTVKWKSRFTVILCSLSSTYLI